jgi:hypothetical protein
MKLHVHLDQQGRPDVVHEVADDALAPAGWEAMSVAEYEEFVSEFPAPPEPAPQSEPEQLSKLSIRRKLRAIGKEEAFDAFLASAPQVLADWQDAQVLLTSDPLFTTYAPVVKSALGLSDAQFAELLA